MRRRSLGGDIDDAQATVARLPKKIDEGGQVVDVLHALAQRLEDDGEVGVSGGDRQQVRGALPLLP